MPAIEARRSPSAPDGVDHGLDGFRSASSRASCPRLSRASTFCSRRFWKEDVDGRDKPGHDSECSDMTGIGLRCSRAVSSVPPRVDARNLVHGNKRPCRNKRPRPQPTWRCCPSPAASGRVSQYRGISTYPAIAVALTKPAEKIAFYFASVEPPPWLNEMALIIGFEPERSLWGSSPWTSNGKCLRRFCPPHGDPGAAERGAGVVIVG